MGLAPFEVALSGSDTEERTADEDTRPGRLGPDLHGLIPTMRQRRATGENEQRRDQQESTHESSVDTPMRDVVRKD
jgi:hypothetical protein